MNLIHVYIEEHKAVRDLNVSLGGSATCHVQNRKVTISKKSDTSGYYLGFHCSAIIGANGVGKSSVLDFIEAAYFPTDSRGALIFYDTPSALFHICLINLDVEDCNAQHEFHRDFDLFSAVNSINLVKINNVSAAQNKLGYGKKYRHSLIHDRTLEEYTRSKIKRKRYFENLLSYFRETRSSNNLIEDVGFEFKFQNSCSRVQGIFPDGILNEEYATKLPELKKNFISKSIEIGSFGTSTKGLFKELVRLNAVSILAELSGVRKVSHRRHVLAFLLQQFMEISVNERSVDAAVGLRQTLEALRYFENWKIFSESPHVVNSIQDSVDVDSMLSRLEFVFELFEDAAQLLGRLQSPFEKTEQLSILIEEFYSVSELVALVSKLPRSILSNISWGWRGVSTGEMARSHLFSETYNYLRNASRGASNIIIIDEADLYLHPEWQRSFLDSYLAHLTMLIRPGCESKPQILLSTHSPIIISDFLPQDITSLSKDSNGNISLRESIGFGTNITSLFIDGMHIESTFGEHSRKAINELLEKAKAGALNDLDKVLIGKMGNKFIKDYLLEND